jgi:hypothetical protein
MIPFVLFFVAGDPTISFELLPVESRPRFDLVKRLTFAGFGGLGWGNVRGGVARYEALWNPEVEIELHYEFTDDAATVVSRVTFRLPRAAAKAPPKAPVPRPQP